MFELIERSDLCAQNEYQIPVPVSGDLRLKRILVVQYLKSRDNPVTGSKMAALAVNCFGKVKTEKIGLAHRYNPIIILAKSKYSKQ